MMKGFKGLSKTQENVLGAIAINDDLGHNPQTIKSLLKKGLIVETKEKRSFNDGLPVMTIKRYSVPLPIHIEWCEWCSKPREAG